MKCRIITTIMAVGLLGTPCAAVANNFHVVLNGFSQEVHAADGYDGVTGTSARTFAWWYRSHVTPFPSVWGLAWWGGTGGHAQWSVQLESSGEGGINLEITKTKIAWDTQRNPVMASLQDGQWHHVVITAPEAGTMGDIRLYLDGDLIPIVAVRGGSLTNSYNTGSGFIFRVGARNLGNHANADIDEVALWNVELSAMAVAEIFNGGTPTDLTQPGSSYTSAANLQLYWGFEEGAGLTTADVSGHGHSGVLIAGDTIDSWGTIPPGSGSDSDGDGFLDGFDNCPDDFNPGQEDADLDQIGDACDPFPENPNNDLAQCEVDLAVRENSNAQLTRDLLASQVRVAELEIALDQCLNPPIPPTQCSDGIDNDDDGSIDLEDRQCLSAEQDSEKHRNR